MMQLVCAQIVTYRILLVGLRSNLFLRATIFRPDCVKHLVVENISAGSYSLLIVISHDEESFPIIYVGTRHSCLWSVKVFTS